MNDFFNPDNRFMRALSRLFDLMILNFFTLLLCIPIITAGASITAMHSVLIQMAEDREGYIVRTFFAKFKENFRQATLIWLIILAVIAVFFLDFRIVSFMTGITAQVLQSGLIVLMLVLLLVVQYIFPLTARYENTIRGIFDSVVKLSIGFFPKSIAMVVINAAVIVLGYRYLLHLLPILVMFGISGPGYLCAMLYMTIFHKIEPAKPENAGGEEDAGEGTFASPDQENNKEE